MLRVKICHEIITDTLLTSDTLTISGECYDIINSNVQPKSKIMLNAECDGGNFLGLVAMQAKFDPVLLY